jgi:hypothetical protein
MENRDQATPDHLQGMHNKEALSQMGALEPEADIPVEGLQMSDTAVVTYNRPMNEYGSWDCELFPATQNGNECYLLRETWVAKPGYSAHGSNERILSKEQGEKLKEARRI